MRTRRLGRTGVVVGELGIGTRGFTRAGFDAADARRMLAHAVDRGIDLIDVWANADVERIAGDVVRDLRARDRVVVATKVEPVQPARGDLLHQVFPAGHVQDRVEHTLRATRLEVVPLEVLHPWTDAWLDDPAWPELRGTLARLVHEGKVLHWGVAAGDAGPDAVVRTLDEPIVEVAVVAHNMFDRRAAATLWAAATARDAGVIVRSPLDAGALGGELSAGATFPAGDARAAAFAGDRLAEVAVRLARLAEHVATTPVAARSTDAAREALEAAEAARRGADVEARTVAELALRFALASAAVTAVVPGMRSRAHLDANLAIADGRALSAALLDRLAEHAWPSDTASTIA